MGTWQSQAKHTAHNTQNTADITLHRLLALRHCKLLLRTATPCGLGPTGHMTPSQTHCSHIPSAQTQAGARAHVLLRRTHCCKRRPLPRQRFKHNPSTLTASGSRHHTLHSLAQQTHTLYSASHKVHTAQLRTITSRLPHAATTSH